MGRCRPRLSNSCAEFSLNDDDDINDNNKRKMTLDLYEQCEYKMRSLRRIENIHVTHGTQITILKILTIKNKIK